MFYERRTAAAIKGQPLTIEVKKYGLTRHKGLLHRFLSWESLRLYAVGGKTVSRS